MEKTIRLLVETALAAVLGIILGFMLVENFYYYMYVFIIINLALFVETLISLKKAADCLDYDEDVPHFVKFFMECMTNPIEGLIRKFKLDSILFASFFFFFLGSMGYSIAISVIHIKNMMFIIFYIILLAIYALFYIRALIIYQKKHAFR
ncbi:MAG: hypothetical protein NTU81_00835 [Candidatus Nomurabacteria bacterium]|nr:hypothetical protein [Candidatus Nomurabacteria bacterium]